MFDRGRGGLPGSARARSVLGLLALSEGEGERAVEELTMGDELLERWGLAHPGAVPILPDLVEAHAVGGDAASARAVLRRLEDQAASLGYEWCLAAVERSRGMLALAAGDPGAAIDPLQRAEAIFDRLGHQPDAARAVLARGRALLMSGHRADAAQVLTEARGRFAEISAPLWEARAAEQLERAAPGSVGGRPSEVELQVAALAVRGLKNREIAEALFIAVATVEAHLTRLYRRLGIRTRSELARHVAEGRLVLPDDPGSPGLPRSPA